MLDGAFTSPKIRRLALILGVPWPHALGLCGLLWRFAAKHAPTGEIGRHDDEEVAAALEWPGDEDVLIDALVRCRLLDRVNGPARLLVHDWPDHAPRYVASMLQRRGEEYSKHYSEECSMNAVPTVVTTASLYSYTSSSSSTPTPSSAPTQTLAISGKPRAEPIPQKLLEAIWDCWVPGRKQGKKPGLESIKRSIRHLTTEHQCSIMEAGQWIAYNTAKQRDAYLRSIQQGETELRFVPLGSTFFSQERWNDQDEVPTVEQIREARIVDEIERARAEMG